MTYKVKLIPPDKPNPQLVSRLRNSIEDKETYDIFVATPLDIPHAIKRNKSFYGAIREMCKQEGHKAFFPHDYFLNLRSPNALFSEPFKALTGKVMIPQCDLFLGHIGVPSHAVGMMYANATSNQKPVIHFHEKGIKLETIADTLELIGGAIYRKYPKKMLKTPTVFCYSTDPRKPFKKYPKLKKVIQYDNPNQCVEFLRDEIRTFFQS